MVCIEHQRKHWPQGSAVIAATGGGLPTQTTAFFVLKLTYQLKIMQLTITAIAHFFASSVGPIEAGEVIATIVTERDLQVTRDLLPLLRSGQDFAIETRLETGELLSLLRTGDKVFCESDDAAFEKDRDPEVVEQMVAKLQEDQAPPPRRRRRKAPAE